MVKSGSTPTISLRVAVEIEVLNYNGKYWSCLLTCEYDERERCLIITFISRFFLINQDESHHLNPHVSTRVGSSSTKPDSGITGTTVVFVVTHDTDSCSATTTPSVEPFLVTIVL